MQEPADGLYDHLLTRSLEELIARARGRVADLQDLREDAHLRLARFLADEIARILRTRNEPGEQAALANRVLRLLWEAAGIDADAGLEISEPARVLRALSRRENPMERPETSLGVSTLLTRPGQPDLGHELAREIASSDRIDALVAFVTLDGVRRLRWALERHRPLRLLTTTYLGATSPEALETIAGLPGAEVRVSYDGRRSRLHAKAWLFHRRTGASTAYIGSANLSHSALSTGLECYEDYAISLDLFHWQSQSTTSDTSPTGGRYVEQETNGWSFLLLVRPTVQDPYIVLGPVRYVSHTGSRPMSIHWRLENPLPAELFQRLATLLAA